MVGVPDGGEGVTEGVGVRPAWEEAGSWVLKQAGIKAEKMRR